MASFPAIAGLLALLFAADGRVAPSLDSQPSYVASTPQPFSDVLHDSLTSQPNSDPGPVQGGSSFPLFARRFVPVAAFAAASARPILLLPRLPLRLLFCTWLV